MATVDHATRNEAAARRWVDEVMNGRNAAAIDELMAPTFEAHPLFYNPYIPSRMQGGSWIERQKAMVDRHIMGLEDLHTTIDQLVAAGDTVTTVTTTTGTRDGKPVSYSSVSITRFEDGKMAEGWLLWDRLGVYQQLGVLPETPELMRQAGLET